MKEDILEYKSSYKSTIVQYRYVTPGKGICLKLLLFSKKRNFCSTSELTSSLYFQCESFERGVEDPHGVGVEKKEGQKWLFTCIT